MMDVLTADALLAPIRPSETDVQMARRSASELGRLPEREGSLRVVVSRGATKAEIAIPEIAFRLLKKILDELAQGHAVSLSLVDQEVSTQKAADLLNVSRPYLIKLLESGKIPFKKVGTHRRIRHADVLEYKARMDAEADRAYADLVQQAQELGMGYG
ncbi:MAG TPA: helix-turn-helix domain-containing protein [Longimicrobium sp.]|nr:helix-turn-helix domain-containing protein [Longimicrobium sp.]